ncbi:MAG: CoA pyrophosphatase [Candidatus Methanoliparum thermophilum]|uniref:CoA pyrophosphatase n=1 Tax=Methanoliparum thermophilum TaxID=2491083 RepID=A0A520KQT5_METT2|nr:MAG: CoA pyrophosphatase [Candidatus Methanoliparum thermophilum]
MYRLREILAHRERDLILDNNLKQSAVLVPLFKKDHDYDILFIKRAENLTYHKGEVSFPGGARENNEDLKDTALRESYEEIGLKPKDVDVLGVLDDIKTISSSFIVTSFVGIIPYPYNFLINKKEVQRIISVPLSFFIDNSDTVVWNYKGDTIWGGTAFILKNFLSILEEYKIEIEEF